jgi:hypothetical protein
MAFIYLINKNIFNFGGLHPVESVTVTCFGCAVNRNNCLRMTTHPDSLSLSLHGLSPRANYTDRATGACRRSDCQPFADRGFHMVSVMEPYGRFLGFLDRSRYFSIK